MTSIARNAWAAPAAGVLLALSAAVLALGTQTTGVPVALARFAPYPPGIVCINVRYVIVHTDARRRVFLNHEPAALAALPARLHEIFRTRAEKVVYLTAAPELTFGQVAAVLDVVRGVVPRVALLPAATPAGYDWYIDAKFGRYFGNQRVLRSQ